ncbi:MAG: hypothetical protein BWY54_00552 [Candidatus Dependentiae bacterium ADurb.Bin331]|nr:MAG: hypothetical protein BWY54_00552 [Candidatus Dependentiae bacterium ADurb.Bin331]
MQYALFSLLFVSFFTLHSSSINIKPDQAKKIGYQIWKNECNATIEGLTSWNPNEDFPSLGIGHFIWHPRGKIGVFHDSFPALLTFLKNKGTVLPPWLEQARLHGCPWHSREEFLKDVYAARMVELRTLLVNTIDLQIAFMVNRLKKTLPRFINHCSLSEQKHIKEQFYRVATTLNGIYALVDYVNFKGEGIHPREAYGNHRWGLLQVLKTMNGHAAGKEAVADFAACAKQVLTERVLLAPKDKPEDRWLPGWFNRINTYLHQF